ncbi:MAG: diacylglycerol kinase [Coriobacteriia bacterium]|nr:diacylglycerol kinase [Coriobacteriia bacterium]
MTAPSRRSILWSFNFAIEGIVYALRTQRNMRVHVVFAMLIAVVSLVLGIPRLELVAVVFAVSLVLVTELVNTAIEAAVDLSVEQFDPLAKVAKDVAAGAVLVAAINALAIAYLVLFDDVRRVLQDGLNGARLATPDLTVIALGLVLLAVIALKAISREGTWMRGGWPSGHAAIAFAAATIVGFVTGNASALALGYFIAVLVVQSRVESEVHTIPQSLVGAVLGVVLTTAVFQVFFW